jgi:methylmalonyl-CoA mutase N-terminal domain/subunit
MTSTKDLSDQEREQELERLRAEVAAWRARYAKAELRDLAFVNSEGEVEPVYTPLDVEHLDAASLPMPGEFPYTRGIHPSGYRGRLWTMRQFAGFGSASDTNQRFKFLLEHGQTGLSTAFDFPTLMGYDSDHPRSEGEVGKTGVAISSLDDMETLFDGIARQGVDVDDDQRPRRHSLLLLCGGRREAGRVVEAASRHGAE